MVVKVLAIDECLVPIATVLLASGVEQGAPRMEVAALAPCPQRIGHAEDDEQQAACALEPLADGTCGGLPESQRQEAQCDGQERVDEG